MASTRVAASIALLTFFVFHHFFPFQTATTMKSLFTTFLVVLGISASLASRSFSRGVTQRDEGLVFGLPRGGGLFGGSKQYVYVLFRLAQRDGMYP